MQPTKLARSLITIPERLRKDYGDDEMDSLCDSIERFGLICPIVIDADNNLIDGGRRLAALDVLKWKEIPVYYREKMPLDMLHELELEANLQRKEMTWQERVCSIAKIHHMKTCRSASEGEKWGMRETGAMLGLAVGKVKYTVDIASRINAADAEVIACDGITEAIKLLIKREQDAAMRELSIRSMAPEVGAMHDAVADAVEEPTSKPPPATIVPITSMLLRQHDLSLSVLKGLPSHSIDHCITDPPYGIDMKMLDQENQGMQNIQSVAVSHDVNDNLAMFDELFPLVYRVLKEKGFFVLWCDIMNWQRLFDTASRCGFRVQRWPFVWCKTHMTMNQAAQYNFTKDTEIAMICAKKNASLVRVQSTSYALASNEEVKKQFKDHPFVKPPECWTPFIEAMTNEGDTILEPFAGRGSGVLPMLKAGRKVVAIEYDETHYTYLVDNVKQYFLTQNSNTKFI